MTDYNATRRLDRIMCSQGDGTGTSAGNVAGKTVSAATNATPIEITATAHGYSDGDFVNISGIAGNTAANGLHVVTNKAANTFELYTSDGVAVAGNGATGAGDSHLCTLIKPGATETFDVMRINIVAGDSAVIAVNQYLGLAAISPGIILQVRNAAGIIKTLTATPVTAWNLWGLNAGVDVPVMELTGNNTEGVVRWTFTKGGPPIRLVGSAGEFMVMLLGADIDGLDYHLSAVQGEKV